VFVPGVQHDSSGTTWGSGPTPGSSISIDDFFVARPTDAIDTINEALAGGRTVLFTPGIYQLNQTIKVKRADTVVLGLGFPTLVPPGGDATMTRGDRPGRQLRAQ